MITFEQAKKKVIPKGSNLKVKQSCEYKDWYVFTLNDRPGAVVDPLSVNKTTGKIEVFNPLTVGGETFSAAMKLLK